MRGLFILVIVLSVGRVGAQEKAKAESPVQAADKVLAAFELNDAVALKALARRDEPDPWLVADELCARSRFDTARAFGRSSPRPDTDRLAEYVSERKGAGDETVLRNTLTRARTLAAADSLESALKALEAVGEGQGSVATVRSLTLRAHLLRKLGRIDAAMAAFLRAAELAGRIGWRRAAARGFGNAAATAFGRKDYNAALVHSERQLAVAEDRGDERELARLLYRVATLRAGVGDRGAALRAFERSRALHAKNGNEAEVARVLLKLGVLHCRDAAYGKGLAYLEEARRLARKAGEDKTEANALVTIATAKQDQGDYDGALRRYAEAIPLLQAAEDTLGVARLWMNLAGIELARGNLTQALRQLQKSLQAHRALAEPSAKEIAVTLTNLGVVYHRLGDFPRALDYYGQALAVAKRPDVSREAAELHMNVALAYGALGDSARATKHQTEARRLAEAQAGEVQTAAAFFQAAKAHERTGSHREAVEYFRKALALYRAAGGTKESAAALVGVADGLAAQGKHREALGAYRQALQIHEVLRDHAALAMTLGNVGQMHQELEEYEQSIECRRKALAIAEQVGARETALFNLWGLAGCHYVRGELEETMEYARRGIGELLHVSRGLADEHSIMIRDRFGALFELGATAAKRLGRVDDAVHFLEAGRAGALLTALGGREAVQSAAIRPESLAAEANARRVEAAASVRCRQALAGGDIATIKKCRGEYEAARRRVMDVVERIQREERSAASVAYPSVAAVSEIARSVREDEVLVLYALFSERAWAVVVRGQETRLVDLGKTTVVEQACSALLESVGDRPKSPLAAVDPRPAARLRDLVCEPLAIAPEERALVAPHGALGSAPFAILFPQRDVLCVPSGTTYRVLLDEAEKRGKDVLALGDPEYRAGSARTSPAPRREFTPLPGTAEEAQAVGDTVLLRGRATEAAFTGALVKRARWRAVHLACHGSIRADQPLLSSLALTRDTESDGLLSALEIFRMRIPADLVVLSACETAKGKIYRAEGIIGFTRAFMIAGAPRVIVSLWKVDDQATRALMVKFYELWNPKDGSAGLPTATALKRAQEFVKSHEKWKHPYYWAAWQLWGLGD